MIVVSLFNKMFTANIKATAEEWKEVEEFCKEDKDPIEIKEEKKIITIALVGLLALIVLMIVGGFLLGSALKTVVTISTNEKSSVFGDSKAFHLGDLVTLKDNTEWYVMKDCSMLDSRVLLFSKKNVNSNNVVNSMAEEYVNNEYKNGLISSLKVKDEYLDVRLLNYGDISDISGVKLNDIDISKKIDLNKLPSFIYEDSVITSEIDDDYNSIYLLKNDSTNSLSFVSYNKNSVAVIKPVIEIDKKFVNSKK